MEEQPGQFPAWKRHGQGIIGLIGLRTLKSGLAVALAVWAVQFVPFSLPLLAGVAAVICMQPTIAGGVAKGITRTQATVLGGLTGLLLYALFGPNPLAMGLGVIVVIRVCNTVGWEDGIALASLTVIAVMLQPEGMAVPYALGRATSTVAGIVTATVVNAAIMPPRHRPVLEAELRRLLSHFPHLYSRAIEAYASNNLDEVAGVEAEVATIRDEMGALEAEVDYLKVCSETPYGSWLEGISLEDYLLAQRGVEVLDEVLSKIEDIVHVSRRRIHRREELLQSGRLSSEEKGQTPEFQELLDALLYLARELGQLHQQVFQILEGADPGLMDEIEQRADQLRDYRHQVRERLKSWEAEYIDQMDFRFLMSANRIVFDLEEIAGALEDLARQCSGTGRRGRERCRGQV